MKRLIAVLCLAGCAGLLGCTNAVYYYETDKVSFTAEARPDSTSPVSASLGVKQRVALLVPPGDPQTSEDVRRALAEGRENQRERAARRSLENATRQLGAAQADQDASAAARAQANVAAAEAELASVLADREARTKREAADVVSPTPPHPRTGPPDPGAVRESRHDALPVISYFNFRKNPTKYGALNDKFVIESAFITGAAAEALGPQEAAGAAQAISLASGFGPADFTVVTQMYVSLQGERSSPEKLALLARLAQLGELVPQRLAVPVYALSDGSTQLKRLHDEGESTDGTMNRSSWDVGFYRLMAYWGLLRTSESALKSAFPVDANGNYTALPGLVLVTGSEPNTVTHTLDAAALARLRTDLAETAQLLEQLQARIGASGSLGALASHYSDRLR